MIIVNDVYKRYTTRNGVSDWVLKGINLVIPKNRSVGIVGRNGAGKSTLLRIICGADYATYGTVERRCRVSWPMGSGGVESTMTGRQNARFICRVHGDKNSADSCASPKGNIPGRHIGCPDSHLGSGSNPE